MGRGSWRAPTSNFPDAHWGLEPWTFGNRKSKIGNRKIEVSLLTRPCPAGYGGQASALREGTSFSHHQHFHFPFCRLQVEPELFGQRVLELTQVGLFCGELRSVQQEVEPALQ